MLLANMHSMMAEEQGVSKNVAIPCFLRWEFEFEHIENFLSVGKDTFLCIRIYL